MCTFSNPRPSVELARLMLVPKNATDCAEMQPKYISNPSDRGLGCIRGFVFAMFCNLSFVLLIAAGWEAWHLLR
jgi:hypothetical protein